MNNNIHKIRKAINHLSKYIGEISPNIPDKDDTKLKLLFKSVGLLNTSINVLYTNLSKNGSIEQYIKQHGLIQYSIESWDTIYNMVYKSVQETLFNQNKVILIHADDYKRIYSIEFNNGMMLIETPSNGNHRTTVYAKNDSVIEELFDMFWKQFDNKVHLSTKSNEKYYNYNTAEKISFKKQTLCGKEKILYDDIKNKISKKDGRSYVLIGPPGSGKTTILENISTELDIKIVKINLKLFSNFIAEDLIIFTKFFKPDLLIIDDIDHNLKEVSPSLLDNVDFLKKNSNIMVAATANDINNFHSAYMRPGRFDEIIEIGFPDFDSRMDIVNYYCEYYKFSFLEEDKIYLSNLTKNHSAAYIKEYVYQMGYYGIDKVKEVMKIRSNNTKKDKVETPSK